MNVWATLFACGSADDVGRRSHGPCCQLPLNIQIRKRSRQLKLRVPSNTPRSQKLQVLPIRRRLSNCHSGWANADKISFHKIVSSPSILSTFASHGATLEHCECRLTHWSYSSCLEYTLRVYSSPKAFAWWTWTRHWHSASLVRIKITYFGLVSPS